MEKAKVSRTLVMLKPDAVVRGLIGKIISYFENKGLKIVAMKMLQLKRALAEKHYQVHKDKAFFEELISYITSAPVVVMVVEGHNAVEVVRKLVGATSPSEASPGTIRGDLASVVTFNLVHASDSEETAQIEIANFFTEKEIYSYSRDSDRWLTSG